MWRDNVGGVLDPMLWHTMHSFSIGCVIMVVASDYYNESDYIRNYDEFMKSPNYAKFKEEVAQRMAFREAEELEKQRIYQEAVFNNAMRDPNIRAPYIKRRMERLAQTIRKEVENAPERYHERGELIPFQKWPEHWKKDWLKLAEKKYEKFTPRPSKGN